MTETPSSPTELPTASTHPDPSAHPDASFCNEDLALNPANVLLHLIVLFLAPMFLGATAGNVSLARMAALETVNAYRLRNPADLLAVAQIIACGLAALGSLSLSMDDDISIPLALRLRGNANALNRTAEINRRAISDSRRDDAPTAQPEWSEPAEAVDAQRDAAVLASLEETRKRVAEAQRRLDQEAAPATEQKAAPVATRTQPLVARTLTERQNDAIWASAMAEVASEFAVSLPHLPPAERRHASMRAAALNSSANALLLATAPPGLKPGALGAITRSGG